MLYLCVTLCICGIYVVLQLPHDANIKIDYFFQEKKCLKVELSDRDLSTAVKLHCQPCNKL